MKCRTSRHSQLQSRHPHRARSYSSLRSDVRFAQCLLGPGRGPELKPLAGLLRLLLFSNAPRRLRRPTVLATSAWPATPLQTGVADQRQRTPSGNAAHNTDVGEAQSLALGSARFRNSQKRSSSRSVAVKAWNAAALTRADAVTTGNSNVLRIGGTVLNRSETLSHRNIGCCEQRFRWRSLTLVCNACLERCRWPCRRSPGTEASSACGRGSRPNSNEETARGLRFQARPGPRQHMSNRTSTAARDSFAARWVFDDRDCNDCERGRRHFIRSDLRKTCEDCTRP